MVLCSYLCLQMSGCIPEDTGLIIRSGLGKPTEPCYPSVCQDPAFQVALATWASHFQLYSLLYAEGNRAYVEPLRHCIGNASIDQPGNVLPLLTQQAQHHSHLSSCSFGAVIYPALFLFQSDTFCFTSLRELSN